MLSPIITTELSRIALKKLSELDVQQTAKALRSLRRAMTGAALLPAAGAFGAGLAIGAGAGILFAPRSGKETRAAIASKVGKLAARLRPGRPEVVDVHGEPASEENLGNVGGNGESAKA